ncbi:DUF4259 domain-containing protein [Streptomyces sp. NPDC088725]|uniref:DUF4259 domain-containing protein n=1 Tax=Streptomyces sp. NPDC088725 TaxID=3365873 RepID=UPI003814041D
MRPIIHGTTDSDLAALPQYVPRLSPWSWASRRQFVRGACRQLPDCTAVVSGLCEDAPVDTIVGRAHGKLGCRSLGNDTAADFCDALDEEAAGEREGIVRAALTRAIDTTGYLGALESEEAIAAAALVAAQCPGGEPADAVYGPEEPLPDLVGLRVLAIQALDRVMAEPSELMDLFR